MSRGGRSTGLTFNAEATLGVGRDNIPTTVLTPPPKYPPLSGQPSPLVLSTDQEYMLAIGKEMMRSLRGFDSKDIVWSHIPNELKNVSKRKRSTNGNPRMKKVKKATLSLDALESMEEKDAEDPDEEKKKENEEEEEEDRGSGEDEDEELDEGTDYANNYFDNGEDYGNDDDDNLDEGGIY
ncbi:unnamed protein product [Lepeophtheirus salmonis]|uniref:(salmon louse) hypothetical protein n=1 Tax=Lepeophtheirus salmonis TaxID=72036 RepID=A0A0K2TJP3_LEPSM|nr:DNA-directed RNA polymerase III subunit RPC7-like [Lepeophtheirus salmonis]CAB4068873.1 unnamed protein product [Lepeophtheirus salmonis]CAF3017403.1 unnamed protein product [Lepeophtheirus salmonis]